MSRLDDLIQELCPDGVEYKRLKDVASFSNGKGHEKNIANNGKYIVVNSKFISTNGIVKKFSNVQICPLYVDDILMVMSDLPDGKTLAKCFLVDEDDKYTLNQRIGRFHTLDENIITTKFLLNILNRNHQLLSYDNGIDQTNLRKDTILNIDIPIPPIPVQQEIVHLLDDFTAKTAELQEELNKEYEARKKQYEYYVTRLFLNSESSWETMANIASFVYGYTDKAKDIGDTRFIRITDIDEQGNLKQEDAKYITMNDDAKKSLLSNGDLVMARTGATYGKTLYFEDETPSVYASFLIKIIPNNNKLLNKYYWYFTKTYLYWNQANSLVTTGGQPQFNTPALKQVKIPVPSLERQKVIIDALDIYENLYNVLQSKISSEIESRQKQYEFYRDKLLTFKESNESEVN